MARPGRTFRFSGSRPPGPPPGPPSARVSGRRLRQTRLHESPVRDSRRRGPGVAALLRHRPGRAHLPRSPLPADPGRRHFEALRTALRRMAGKCFRPQGHRDGTGPAALGGGPRARGERVGPRGFRGGAPVRGPHRRERGAARLPGTGSARRQPRRAKAPGLETRSRTSRRASPAAPRPTNLSI